MLDYETNDWDPLDEQAKELLSKQKYVSMSAERRKREAAETPADGDDSSPSDGPNPNGVLPYDTPQAAAKAYRVGKSLFTINLPGMMSLEETKKEMESRPVIVSINGKHYVAEVRLPLVLQVC